MAEDFHSDGTPIWIRTSSISGKNGSVQRRKSVTQSTRMLSTNGAGASTDWGWVFGHAFVSTTSKRNSHRTAKGNTNCDNLVSVTISDASHAQNQTSHALSMKNDDFVMANPHDDPLSHENPPDDLITLTHLHEPAIVSALSKRYASNNIYTSTGPMLLALNPFKRCPHLYSTSMHNLYSEFHEKKKRFEKVKKEDGAEASSPFQLPPHVYAIADKAFRKMTMSWDHSQNPDHKSFNQSILVSGESGAGKTVTTKFIMNYLAKLSEKTSTDIGSTETGRQNNSDKSGGTGSIEEQVLQSNPILESFGNARTMRNDNSSRFGKFIEIRFKPSSATSISPSLIGASIKTYLLEKVRVITQSPGERNYHIFYEILKGASEQEKDDFYLYDLIHEDFKLTNSSGTFTRRDGVNDISTYNELRKAMDTMEFNLEMQTKILKVVCALMHSSNITFHENGAEGSVLDTKNPFLGASVTLLGVTVDDINRALCSCAIEARGEKLVKRLSVSQATKALEAFIKSTYAALFHFIVHAVNDSIAVKNRSDTSEKHKNSRFIGVLDVFGFESFVVNSFEQLCINYCNEALQQQFNKFVFKHEQEEYEREGIEWSFIAFPDNQDVLDLIDKKHTGILSVLDEQCRLAKCTDRSFVNSLYKRCVDHPRFDFTPTQQVSGLFFIVHYAGKVEYDSMSFLEKNKDDLPKESTELLKSSTNAFLPLLIDFLVAPTSPRTSPLRNAGVENNGNAKPKQRSSLSGTSVGSQFQAQLRDLRERIEHTSPQYIRCLKPNDDLLPNKFMPVIIADQLRCAGVLEAVRLSRVGFSQRYTHAIFLMRYRMICPNELATAKRLNKKCLSCRLLVEALATLIIAYNSAEHSNGTEEDGNSSIGGKTSTLILAGMQFGKTKVFLRQPAFNALENLRNQKMEVSSIRIQSIGRTFLARMHYFSALKAILRIQSQIRRVKAAIYVTKFRQIIAATMLQKNWRKVSARRKMKSIIFLCIWAQCHFRGNLGRIKFSRLNRIHNAVIIQKFFRRAAKERSFQLQRLSAVLVQCAFRCYCARQSLLSLKKEAKDLTIVVRERNELKRQIHDLKKSYEHKLDQCKKIAEKEILQLKQELEHIRHRLSQNSHQIVSGNAEHVGNLPKKSIGLESPTEQEKELSRLRNECDEKSREIEKLKKEITLLHKDLPEARREDVDEEIPSESTNFVGKIFGLKNQDLGAFGLNSQDDKDILHDDVKAEPEPIFSNGFTPITFFSRQLFQGNVIKSSDMANQNREQDQRLSMFDGDTLSSKKSDDSSIKDDSFSLTQLHQCEIASSVPSVLNSSFVDSHASESPLHIAIKSKDKSMLERAINDSNDIQRDINTGDLDGKTPLHLASLNSCHELMSIILDHTHANSQDLRGNTPLHDAQDSSTIEVLLNKGANPNIPNERGICPLHIAVKRLDVEAVNILLKHNADVNAADNDTWYSSFHLIAQSDKDSNDREALPSHLLQLDTEISPRSQIATLLCNSGSGSNSDFDLSAKDIDGNTPLHHAAILGEYDALQILQIFLKKGSDPNISNDRGQTPLHLVCHNEALREFEQYNQVLRLLMSSGGDANISSQSGCTALHLTVYHGDIDSAILLLQHGGQLHIPWEMPSNWESYWNETGAAETLVVDMIVDDDRLKRLLSAISCVQESAPVRRQCMQCCKWFGTFGRRYHCRHCGRLVCGSCATENLDFSFFPPFFEQIYEEKGNYKVCYICEEILLDKKEDGI